jgi:ribose transport system ATP-binding protein
MKMLAGVYTPDRGTISVGGEEVSFGHPVQAQQAGISTVFQEFNLLPERTIAENIYLGREPRRFPFGPIDTARMRRETEELLAGLGVHDLRPGDLVRSLSVAEQQVVEIAKAVSFDAQVIQMDEPTAALADHEVELLYAIIRRLTDRGVAILYVSHRLKEIFDLCQTITILKDGQHVTTQPADQLTESALVRLMVGRPLTSYFPEKSPDTEVGEVRLELQGVGNAYVDDVSLQVRAGEIVGLAGLQGSGRTELLEAVFGVHPVARGSVLLDGTAATIRSPRQGVRSRLAFITEDRKAKGLSLNQSILDNALGVVRAVFPRRTGEARRSMPGVFSNLEVSARSLGQEVQFLSGGNQQKVVLARWLSIDPLVVLMDEPTRGIDVGAKHGVYELMRELTRNGVAILMVSSELPEVIGMSDRIIVMRDGKVAGELEAGPTEEAVLALATGASTDEEAA